MSEEILINFTPQETRVAVMYQGAVQELHIERCASRGFVGNVYVGRIVRILPGHVGVLYSLLTVNWFVTVHFQRRIARLQQAGDDVASATSSNHALD